MNCIESAKLVYETIDGINKLLGKLDGGSKRSYYLDKINDQIQLLFEKYAPFHVGDRVELTKTPRITQEKSWGWMGSKHFLIKGAKGTVTDVDCDRLGFSCNIVFDDETWIDSFTGEINPVEKDKRGHYCFRESFVKVIKDE